MCGICGIYRFDKKKINLNDLKILNDAMHYRGPDDEGQFIKDNFGMAMKRLSIIDLITGNQPLKTADKKIRIIFNGEIYNYLELKNDLTKLGFKFNTTSDTEVILNSYVAYGEKFVDKLNGMFSICIYDERVSKKVLIFRDRFGIKPLYFFKSENQFIFSSDLNSFNDYSKNLKRSKKNFLNYQFLNYFPKDQTVYEDVKKLLPAHYIIIENNSYYLKRYWDLENSKTEYNNDNYLEEIYNILQESVSINLRSDVLTGLLLSSGIDSSVIAFEVSKNISNQKTFCAYFPEKKKDESKLAEKFSKFIESKHSTINVGKEKYYEILDNILSQIDEPHGDTAIIPTYEISRIARQNNIKVLLSGAGGDELFGGYKRHYKFFKDFIIGLLKNINLFDNNIIKLIPYRYQNYIVKLKSRKFAYAMDTSGQSLSVILNFLNERIYKEYLYDKISNIFSRIPDTIFFNIQDIIYNDLISYLPDNILGPFDKITMLNSVEGRVPFLDHRIIELINFYNLNVVKNNNFQKNKQILRKIYSKKLPDYIFNNEKIGFDAPLIKWHNILNQTQINNLDVFDLFNKNKLKENFTNKDCNRFFYNLSIYKKWSDYH